MIANTVAVSATSHLLQGTAILRDAWYHAKYGEPRLLAGQDVDQAIGLIRSALSLWRSEIEERYDSLGLDLSSSVLRNTKNGICGEFFSVQEIDELLNKFVDLTASGIKKLDEVVLDALDVLSARISSTIDSHNASTL